MIRIAVPGVNGRMGAIIADQILQANDLSLVLATARSAEAQGQKVANSDVVITNELQPTFDVLIDFTLPAGLIQHLDYCVTHIKPIVIGSTGCDVDQIAKIKEAAKIIPILMSANMSIGVNICFRILAQMAPMFDANWDVAILDVHHQHKKDSPSGTAKHMLKILQNNFADPRREVKMQSERVGEVIGSHAVSFTNPYEEIVLSHFGKDRKIYAQGAILAARWLVRQKPGLYSMQDII